MALRTRRRSTCRRTTSRGSVTLTTPESHVTDLSVQAASGMWTVRRVTSGAIRVATCPRRPLFPAANPCRHSAALALAEPAERRLNAVMPGRRLMLAVAPGAARAVLVVPLPARDADHASIVRLGHCRCGPLCGYIPDMSQGEYMLPFPDRRTAGTLLAERLTRAVVLDNWAERTVVLALPRGGVAVAKQVVAVLGVPLNVIVTRKIGYPRQPELGVGAIAEGLGMAVYDAGLLGRLSLSPASLAPVVAAEQAELARQVQVYRGGRPLPPVAGWCVIVVDDGLATGATARAALRSLRAAHAAYLVLAAPVAAPAAAEEMRAEADQVIILATPRRFRSVGQWYTSFGQLTDADVLALLA
jgi:putative phosphoribosyl transferase